MNLPGFLSPPKASRVVEMSNNRVKIINPLSLPTCSNLTGPSATSAVSDVNEYDQGTGSASSDSNRFYHQGYYKTRSSSTSVSFKTPPSNNQLTGQSEPLELVPLDNTTNKDAMKETLSSSENLEFPSSALDLYTSLLDEMANHEDSTSQSVSSLSIHNLPENIPTDEDIGSVTTSKLSAFDGGEQSSKTPQQSDDHDSELVAASSESNLQQASAVQTLMSGLSGTEKEPLTYSLRSAMNTSMNLSAINFDEKLQETIDRLPDVVENVSQAQKHQLEEVSKQQEILHEIQKQLQQEKDNVEDLRAEFTACKRKICFAEDKGTQMEKHCRQLEKEICNGMTEDFEICKLMREEEDKKRENTRLYDKYKDKMSQHSQAVQEVEETLAVNMEVKSQQEAIKSLQTLKRSMKSKLQDVDYEERLQEQILKLSQEKRKLKDDIGKIELHIKQEVSKHSSINQDIDVLHKRNQAQMTRLKKQVKEGHLRNRQWNEEACRLERHLEELRKSMEE